MGKYTWQMIFRDFRQAYPDLWRYGTTYQPHEHMAIMVFIPNVGKLIYERIPNEITWLERYNDPMKLRFKEKEMRPKQYTYFVFLLKEYMKDTGATQQEIAEKSGVSRKSINGYLTGRLMPKLKTMQQVCDALNLNF